MSRKKPEELFEWVGNIYDPKRADAKERFALIANEDRDKAWADHLRWVGRMRIAGVKATSPEAFIALEARFFVGVYRPTAFLSETGLPASKLPPTYESPF